LETIVVIIGRSLNGINIGYQLEARLFRYWRWYPSQCHCEVKQYEAVLHIWWSWQPIHTIWSAEVGNED